MSLFSRSSTEPVPKPHLESLSPAAVLPEGEIELGGANLGPGPTNPPIVLIDGEPAHIVMSRSNRLAVRVPKGVSTGMVEVRTLAGASNTVPLRVAHLLHEDLHPVTSPAIGPTGVIYATISGPRGKQTPISVVRIQPDGRGTPLVTGLLNATGLAFSPDGDLFVTSRADGAVYRVDPGGEFTAYAEGLGVATGAVFDGEGNLYVGDRSGTIFKIDSERRIFVYATLEPSVSAYHLAIDREATLYVTGPTMGTNDAVWAINRQGEARPWFRGLGRPQGLALSSDGDIYLAASLHGRRGIVRISPAGQASLVLSGANLVGLAFSPLGNTILATSDAVYEVDLGVEAMEQNG